MSYVNIKKSFLYCSKLNFYSLKVLFKFSTNVMAMYVIFRYVWMCMIIGINKRNNRRKWGNIELASCMHRMITLTEINKT